MKQVMWSDKPFIKQTVEKALKKGEVILAEGDTVLGLLADLSETGYQELDRIKNRSEKPYLLLVSNKEKALNLIEKNDFLYFQIEKLMNFFWPGPLTLICNAKKGLPWYIRSKQSSIGIRVPQHQGLLELLQDFDGLFSTSANKSGERLPHSMQDLDPEIKKSVEYCLMNDKNTQSSLLPSTILDCTGAEIKIVRQGSLDTKKVMDCLK